MSDLEILFPSAVEITMAGRRVRLKPVLLRDFELFGKVAGALIAAIGSASGNELAAFSKKHGRDLRVLLRRTTSLGYFRVRRLPFPVALQLCGQVISVNSGFFADAQLALATALAGPQLPNAC